MGMGMNWSPVVPLMPTTEHLECLFAEVIALCCWFWPPVTFRALRGVRVDHRGLCSAKHPGQFRCRPFMFLPRCPSATAAPPRR